MKRMIFRKLKRKRLDFNNMKTEFITFINESSLFDFIGVRFNENLDLDKTITATLPDEDRLNHLKSMGIDMIIECSKELLNEVRYNIEKNVVNYLSDAYAIYLDDVEDVTKFLDIENIITNVKILTSLKDNKDFIEVTEYNDDIIENIYKAGTLENTNIYLYSWFDWNDTIVIPYKTPINVEFNVGDIENTGNKLVIKFGMKIIES